MLAANDTSSVTWQAGESVFNSTIFVSFGHIFFIFSLFLILFHWHFLSRKMNRMRLVMSLFSHFLSSNLTGIQLFLTGLKEKDSPDKKMLQKAISTTRDLELLNQKAQEFICMFWKPDLIPLGEILERVSNRNAPIVLKIDEASRNVEVPTTQFYLVVDELVVNARKALTENSFESRILLESRVVETFFSKKLILEVSDNGSGMEKNVLKNAGVPFFTSKSGSYNGLGLTCCTQLMKSISAKFNIVSSPEKGTMVRIVYPFWRIGLG